MTKQYTLSNAISQMCELCKKLNENDENFTMWKEACSILSGLEDIREGLKKNI